MAKTWKFILAWSVGGSTSKDKHTNVLHVNTDALLTSAEMNTLVDQVSDAVRASVLSVATLDQVTVKDPLQEGNGYDPTKVRAFPIGEAGGKAIGVNAADIKQVTTFYRMKAASGRAGHMNLRMAVFDNEVFAGDGGNPDTGGAPAAAIGLADALNALIAAGVSLRKYAKRKDGTITDAVITEVEYGGVKHRTATRSKKKDRKTPPKTVNALADHVLRSISPLYNAIALAEQFEDTTGLPAVAALQTAVGLLLGPLGTAKNAAVALKALV